jgi:TonB family protein
MEERLPEILAFADLEPSYLDAPGVGDKDAKADIRPSPRLPSPLGPFRGRKVRLLVTVDPDGLVQRVRVLQSSGSEAADGVATRTVKQWEYAPAFHKDKAVTAEVVETVTLEGDR